jgi:hypothetical protein
LNAYARVGKVPERAQAVPNVTDWLMSDAGGFHATKLFLELADLIAQSCRQLELKLGRGNVHLVRQLLDQVRELRAWQAGELAGVAADVATA